MYRIEDSLNILANAIERGESIKIIDGRWEQRWRVTALVRNIFGRLFGKNDDITTANSFSVYLLNSALSSENGVSANTWNKRSLYRVLCVLKERLSSKKELEENKIQMVHNSFQRPLSIFDLSKNKDLSRPSPGSARLATSQLDQAECMHHYLGISQDEITNYSPKKEDITWITDQLEQWQYNQFPHVNFFDEKIIEKTTQKLEWCCHYPEFLSLAKKNSALLDLLFYSVFTNMPADSTNAIDLFIQAPHIHKNLQNGTFLDKRIRTVANHGLRFIETDPIKHTKDIQLLINGSYQSISSTKNMVQVAENVNITVQKLFNTFRDHNKKISDLEYLQNGVTLFDATLSNMNLSDKEWWKHLPIIERCTRKELEERYETSFQTGVALCVLRASRTYPDLHAADTHSWLDIAIPLDDETFNLISPGKYSDHFPVTLWEKFWFVFKSQIATLTLIDSNKYFNNREQAALPLPPLSKEKFEESMEILRQDFLRSRNGELIFQSQGDNCASWAVQFTQKILNNPNFKPFEMKFSDLVVPEFNFILKLKKVLSEKQWNYVRIAFSSLFGALQGVKFPLENGKHTTIRLINDSKWKKGVLNNPAILFERLSELKKQLTSPSISGTSS